MKKGLLFIFCLCLFVGCQNYKESYTRCENELSSFCEYSTFLQDQDIDLLRSYNDAQQCIHYDMYRNEKLIFDFDVSLACQNNDIYWSNRYHALVTKDHGSDFENHIWKYCNNGCNDSACIMADKFSDRDDYYGECCCWSFGGRRLLECI